MSYIDTSSEDGQLGQERKSENLEFLGLRSRKTMALELQEVCVAQFLFHFVLLFEFFVRSPGRKGPWRTLAKLKSLLCLSCDCLQCRLCLAKQPQCFQLFPRMWFAGSLTILVIHLRTHLECLYYSGFFIYIVRYCLAKNPTAQSQSGLQGYRDHHTVITYGQISTAACALAPLDMT